MKGNTFVDESFLAMRPAKRWVHDRIVELLASDTVVPAFPGAAMKLLKMSKDEAIGLEDFVSVVSLDQGLSARCLRSAGAALHGGQTLATLDEAIFLIGIRQMRRIALTVGVVEHFNHLRINVNWQKFWLHGVLVARLTERLAGAFRDTTGMEYLAGLLHDVGKLILEHYFPQEFEAIVLRAMERRCGHSAAEFDLLGIDHASIGGAMCKSLNLHREVMHAVHFHHHAIHPAHLGDPEGDNGFLASCVSVADALANMGDVNIFGAAQVAGSLDLLPEWKHLAQFFDCRGLELDLSEEIEKATTEMAVFA